MGAGHRRRSRARRHRRRGHRDRGCRPAPGRLPRHLLHAGRTRTVRQALDRTDPHPRAVLRRTPDPGRRGPLPGHRQDIAPRPLLPGSPICCVETFGPAESGKTARHRRPRRDRAGAGRAWPGHRATGATSTRPPTSSTLAAMDLSAATSTTRTTCRSGSMETIVGHAVRAVYLTTGAADIYTETGDETILTALHRLWDNMTQRRMYVTGGIGSRWEGEAFGRDFELPNARAYTETCAAIGSVMWNWRMLALTGDAKYADLIETTLYNAILPGLSLCRRRVLLSEPPRRRRHPPPRAVVPRAPAARRTSPALWPASADMSRRPRQRASGSTSTPTPR